MSMFVTIDWIRSDFWLNIDCIVQDGSSHETEEENTSEESVGSSKSPSRPENFLNLYWLDRSRLPCVYYDEAGKEENDAFTGDYPYCLVVYIPLTDVYTPLSVNTCTPSSFDIMYYLGHVPV